MPGRCAKGFSREPDVGGLLFVALIVGVIGYAIYAYEGPLWQKLLIAPGGLLVLAAGGLIASLLFGGLFWIFLFVAKQRKKVRLGQLLALEREPDVARARAICESFDFSDSDLFRDEPRLCLQFAEAARRDGPLRPYYLRTLMENAPWSREVESSLFEGREAVAQSDRWRWLYWFRKEAPEGDPAASDRLAAALEHAFKDGNESRRRGDWADCLARVRDSEAWRGLAQRYRGDLLALQVERGEKLDPLQREGLDVLLRGTDPG